MPIFYFHISDGSGFTEDEWGQELADESAARRAAVDGARSIMAEDLRSGELNLASFIEVEDHSHTLVFTLTFVEAIKVYGLS